LPVGRRLASADILPRATTAIAKPESASGRTLARALDETDTMTADNADVRRWAIDVGIFAAKA